MKLTERLNHIASSSATLRELLLGDAGYGLFFLLFALPSALPVPAPGYSVPFGIAIIIVGWQMFSGKKEPWLPEKVAGLNISLPQKGWDFIHKVALMIEKIIQPRLKWLSTGAGRRLSAIIIILCGVSMCVPIPGTNTIPAMAVFLIGVSMLEEDGFLTLLGYLIAFVYVTIIVLALTLGAEVFVRLFQ